MENCDLSRAIFPPLCRDLIVTYILNHAFQVEVAKFEELEEVHAELKLKQSLWNSLVDWDVVNDEWLEVRYITSPAGVWTSDETLFFVLDILLLSNSLSLDMRWDTPSRVWSITFRCFYCLDISWNTPSRVWCITFLCLDIGWNIPFRVWYSFHV